MLTLNRPRFDFVMLGVTLCLVGVGVLLLYSVSHASGLSSVESPYVRHGIYACIGLLLLIVVARVDYRLLATFAPVLYMGAMAMLLLVLAIGHSTAGVSRWIDLGIFPLQPSELAKPIVAIALARYFVQFKDLSHHPITTLGSLLVVAIPVFLVYRQPDLGTAAVFLGIWVGMAIMGGVPATHLAALGLLVVLALPVAWSFVLHSYMQERVLIFLDPTQDPLGAGYNILQSEISVGSGGLTGKGLLHGTQSQLRFLRIQQSDFIFSVLGEELGFVGAMLVFALYALLLLRGLRIASLARDDFGRLLATGVVMMVLVQVFINVGVNVRLLPVTGIPLPFLSFGGSSLMSLLLSLGVLQSIYSHRLRAHW